MFVTNLEIEHFRGIQKGNISFPLDSRVICMIGAGDSTKSTVIKAIEWVFWPSWNLIACDNDFYGCDTSVPIIIRGTFKEIPSKLITEDKFGLYLRKPHVLFEPGVNDEPEDGGNSCLTIQLTIDSTLEPKWEVVCNRKEARPISHSDRKLLSVANVGNNCAKDMVWGKYSVLQKYADAKGVLHDAHTAALREIASHADLHTLDDVGETLISVGQQYGVGFESQIKNKMFIQNGTGYNYGSIYLQGDNTTAIQLDGATASLRVQGNIYHNPEYDGITYFWTSNGASYTLDYPGGVEIENYTLGKATDSGKLTVSENSTVYVRGENSYLLIGDSGAELYNYGTVYASAGASPIVVSGEAKVANGGTINISGGGNAMQGADNNTTLQNLPDGIINVNNGNGMYASNLASPTNYGTINVQEGVGMYLTGMTLSGATTGSNYGSINVSGGGNYGALVSNGAVFTNQGVISVSCADCEGGQYAIGMGGGSNLGTISVKEHGIGIEYGENSGEITISADSAIGMAEGENAGEIKGTGTGMSGGENNGTIDIYSGTGMKNGINNGGITVNNGTGMNNGTNNSTIDVTNGNGGVASDGGRFTNHGEITVGSGNGILVQSGGYGVNSASGMITLAGSGYGAKVEDGDFLNAGTIEFSSKNGGSCANVSVGGECVDSDDETETTSANGLIYIGKNGTFINSGVVDMDGETVGIDQRFSNGLRFPRDPEDGRAEQLINCRCYLTYGGFYDKP